jgi:tripartite-type tricarboxylate transporter receptor subunit TctC
VARTLADLGISRSDITPAQMHRFLEEDRAMWANVVKTSGMKLQ